MPTSNDPRISNEEHENFRNVIFTLNSSYSAESMRFERHVYKMLINGQLVEGTGTFTVTNPATGKHLAVAPIPTPFQVSNAIEAARQGFKVWSKLDLSERSARILKAASIMEANRTDLEYLLSREQGKPLQSAAAEINTAISIMRQAADIELPVKHIKETVSHILQVVRRPVGVVVGITPWNFPLSLGCGKIARSLGHGNSIILKPSPFTPLTSLYLGELLQETFPPGVINILSGDATTGQQLVESPYINMVSFTGSGPTGKKIMASCAANVTRVLLEMGGNDPAIVLPDADIAHAARGIYQMSMANSGQICCAIKRVYVHESIFDEFVSTVTDLAKSTVPKIGEGLNVGVTMGPLNNKMQLERVIELVEDAVRQGAVVHAGGKAPSHTNPGGLFYEPTILTNVREGMRIVDEEQFGPVMPIMSYKTEVEVVERANNSIYGLGASVWGRKAKTLNAVATKLECGIVWTNEHAVLREGGSFGGMKQSGFRHEGDFAEADLESYTEMQTQKLFK
jgi:acyl-CoA reductase-like NAD-dependent aldehyde dehydrogenase